MRDGYDGGMRVNVAEAKNGLPRLIRAVEQGEVVTICRRGAPVVDLVPSRAAAPGTRLLGALRGQVEILDPDWWKPLEGAELERFLGGSATRGGRRNSFGDTPPRARARRAGS